jgi:hypothetical protein
MLGFKSFETAMKTIEGIVTMHMIKKGQVKLKNLSASNNVELFNQLFGMSSAPKVIFPLPSVSRI